MEYRAPRGTFDVLPKDQTYWSYVQSTALATVQRFGYHRIDTPVFEDTTLFARGVGTDTDVVQKEMYTFDDRGGDSLTLKPEGTAPVCRAYIEHGMKNLPQPVRLFYVTPVFRYERPQAGRLRQHHQFGVEAIGDASAQVDAEVIALGWSYLTALGLRGAALKINSIGDPACRPGYLEELRAYYKDHLREMCADCRVRFHRSPLRLLDCKKESCQRFAEEAPRSVDHLCSDCQDHWTTVLDLLRRFTAVHPEFSYQVDHRLVRGLDYYTRTVFEFHPPQEGSQSAILSGGRYDGLIEQIGGDPTPGIGFGSGIERVVLNLRRQEVPIPDAPIPDAVLVHAGDEAARETFRLSAELRATGHAVVVAPAGRSVRSQMRYADSLGARYALILGDRELSRNVATLKSLKNGGGQLELPLDATAIAELFDRQ